MNRRFVRTSGSARLDLRLILAAGCPKVGANKITDLCGVYYPDRIGR